jgi:hypothetical protein
VFRRLGKPPPDSHAALPEDHQWLISTETVAEVPLAGLSLCSYELCKMAREECSREECYTVFTLVREKCEKQAPVCVTKPMHYTKTIDVCRPGPHGPGRAAFCMSRRNAILAIRARARRGHSQGVAGRSGRPSGRRIAQTAAHLADRAIPPVPVRQWVISVPKRLRCFLADRPRQSPPSRGFSWTRSSGLGEMLWARADGEKAS